MDMKRKLTFVYSVFGSVDSSRLSALIPAVARLAMHAAVGQQISTKGAVLMKPVSLRALFALLYSLLFAFSVFGAEQLGGYHLLKKIPMANAPKGAKREYFDYITVDAAARRVYLSHGTEVLVVNADSYSVIGAIPGLKLA